MSEVLSVANGEMLRSDVSTDHDTNTLFGNVTDVINITEKVYQYDDYGQYNQEMHEAFLSSLHRHAATYSAILASWTFVINSIVIVACLQARHTRHDTFYKHVINFSISNILISIFVLPLTVYHILHIWELGQTVCIIWIITDVFLPFVGIIVIIIISIERLMIATNPKLYSRVFHTNLKHVTVVIPWIISSVIVIPLWTVETVPYDKMQFQCIVLVTKAAGLLCPLLTFFIPLCFLVVLTFKLLLLWLQMEESGPVTTFRSSRYTMRESVNNNAIPSQSTYDGENSTVPVLKRQDTVKSTVASMDVRAKTGSMVSVCLVSLVLTVMWFPFQCVSFLLPLCDSQLCVPSAEFNQVITLIGASSSGVVPLCWFADKTIKTNTSLAFTSLMNFCHGNNVKEQKQEVTPDEDETFV